MDARSTHPTAPVKTARRPATVGSTTAERLMLAALLAIVAVMTGAIIVSAAAV
ncbi:MAG: hypothetical protein ACTHN0_03115 [Aquihabitans sp.]